MLKQRPEAVHHGHSATGGQAAAAHEEFVEHPVGRDDDLGAARDHRRARDIEALLDRPRGLLVGLERELVDRRVERERAGEAALQPIGQHEIGVVGGLVLAERDQAEFPGERAGDKRAALAEADHRDVDQRPCRPQTRVEEAAERERVEAFALRHQRRVANLELVNGGHVAILDRVDRRAALGVRAGPQAVHFHRGVLPHYRGCMLRDRLAVERHDCQIGKALVPDAHEFSL